MKPVQFVPVVAAVGFLAACGQNGIVVPTASLEDVTWQLVTLDGQVPVQDTRVTVTFGDERVNGSAGCNSYFGSVTVRGDNLDIGLLATTRVYCTSPDVRDQEQRFLAALQSARTFRIVGTELRISDAEGVVRLVLRIETTR